MGKTSSQMSMKFQRHLPNTITTLSKKVEKNKTNKTGTTLGSLNDTNNIIDRIIESY